VNSGKSTIVRSSLSGQKYVVAYDWRLMVGKIETEEELISCLHRAFDVPFLKTLQQSRIFKGLAPWFLSRFFSISLSEESNLDKCLHEIHTLLEFAQIQLSEEFKNKKARPIIFFDEINALHGLNEKVLNKFIKWLIQISKDEGLCHIVCASSDSFIYQFLMEHAGEPQYIQMWHVESLKKK